MLDAQRKAAHPDAGITGFGLLTQYQRIEHRRIARRGGQEFRVEPDVQFLAKRKHAAGQPNDDEKKRHREPRPAVQPDPEGTGHGQNSARREPMTVSGAPYWRKPNVNRLRRAQTGRRFGNSGLSVIGRVQEICDIHLRRYLCIGKLEAIGGHQIHRGVVRRSWAKTAKD